MSLIIRPNFPNDYAIFNTLGDNKATIIYSGTEEQCNKVLPIYKKQEKFETLLKENDFNIYLVSFLDNKSIESGFMFEISFCSEAGEDFSISLSGKTIEDVIKDLQKQALEFNTEEHVNNWINYCSSNGIPNDRKVLTEDAEYIKSKLLNIEKKVRDLI